MFSFHTGGDTKAKVTEGVAGNLTIARLEAVDRPDGAQRNEQERPGSRRLKVGKNREHE